MPEPKLYRNIVDVLLAEHDRTPPPDETTGIPIHLLACVWGIYAQIHRHARAALLLIDSGMEHESSIMTRVMMEHTIVMHWVIERGDAGVDALVADQSKRMNRWVDWTTTETTLAVPPEIAAELKDGFEGIDEKKAIGNFYNICREVAVEDLYSVYDLVSKFVHASTFTSNLYFDDAFGKLRLTPPARLGEGNISLIAHLLIWAERDFDSLTPGSPKADGLEKLANSVQARPVLPKYHPIPPAAKKKDSPANSGTKEQA